MGRNGKRLTLITVLLCDIPPVRQQVLANVVEDTVTDQDCAPLNEDRLDFLKSNIAEPNEK